MLTVKWKKGVDTLNITSEDASNPSKSATPTASEYDGQSPSTRKLSKRDKKNGYGKFQTCANFLKGEEKEAYEKYLDNKR